MELGDLQQKLKATLEHLREQLAVIRTGRANSSLVEKIRVEAYEGAASLTVKELATITSPEPNLIVIAPWDLSIIPKIESALRQAPGLGVSPVVFDNLIRVPLPPLSEERRREMVKLLKTKLEEARQAVRNIRQDAMRSIDEMEENGVISEDERFRRREEVEKAVREANFALRKMGEEKERELLGR